ncbi:MAG: hypothetical protein JXA93_10745 [Anaerolineae bacterium]|nr:hypothetical protein [Anaerolineae bacterium]
MNQFQRIRHIMPVLAALSLMIGVSALAPTAWADPAGFTDTPTPTTAPTDTPEPTVRPTLTTAPSDTPIPPTDTPIPPTAPAVTNTPHPPFPQPTRTRAPEAEEPTPAPPAPTETEAATPTEEVVPGVPMTGGLIDVQMLLWGFVLVAFGGISAILGRRLSA